MSTGPPANGFRDAARAALALRRYAIAAERARDAIAADPEDATGYLLLALALAEQAEHRAALAAVADAFACDPDNAWAHRVDASLRLALGDLPAALAAADAAVRVAPSSSDAHGMRARVLLRQDRLDLARVACRRALELDAGKAWLHRLLGDLELRAKDNAAAEAAYRATLRIEPRDPRALNDLGVALQRQGRDVEATLAYRGAIALDPGLKIAKRNTLGAVRNLTGTWRSHPLTMVAGFGCFVLAGWLLLSDLEGPLAGVGAALYVVGVGGVMIRRLQQRSRAAPRREAAAELRRRDPALFSLVEQLERDRREGRLVVDQQGIESL